MTGKKDDQIDLGNRKEVTDRKKKIKSSEETFKADLHFIMNNPQGRRFIWTYVKPDAAMFLDPHVQGDPYQTAYLCGRASFARTLMKTLHQPQYREKYALMVDENATE